ncbi:MAG: hypothetical protein IPG92_11685 [Flavobacteriales bacterium]|nr:hypothetical protein [Flavobacteriales bacterium]
MDHERELWWHEQPIEQQLLCTAPTVTPTVVPGCPGGFSLELDFTDLGDGAPYTITYTVNGGAPIAGGSVSSVEVVTLTGFSSNDDVDVTITHATDSDCNLTFNNNTFSCPPPNDLCVNAPVTVIGNNATVNISGNSAGALNNDGPTWNGDPQAWEAIQLTSCAATLELNWCTTAPGYTLSYNAMASDCPELLDIIISGPDQTACPNGNRRFVFANVLPVLGTSLFGPRAPSRSRRSPVMCAAAAPANDDCANAEDLFVGANGSCPTANVGGTTVSATESGSAEPSCLIGIPGLNDVFYTFNAETYSSRVDDRAWNVERAGCADT